MFCLLPFCSFRFSPLSVSFWRLNLGLCPCQPIILPSLVLLKREISLSFLCLCSFGRKCWCFSYKIKCEDEDARGMFRIIPNNKWYIYIFPFIDHLHMSKNALYFITFFSPLIHPCIYLTSWSHLIPSSLLTQTLPHPSSLWEGRGPLATNPHWHTKSLQDYAHSISFLIPSPTKFPPSLKKTSDVFFISPSVWDPCILPWVLIIYFLGSMFCSIRILHFMANIHSSMSIYCLCPFRSALPH